MSRPASPLWPLIHKEMLHVVRDRRMLFVVIAIPIMQLLLFGFAISTELTNINVAVSIQDYDSDVSLAISRLQNNPYVSLRGSLPQADIYTALRNGEADAVVVFSNGAQVQIVTDASNPNTAQAASRYLRAIILPEDARPPLPISTHLLYNPLLKSSYTFVPGIMGMLFMLLCSLMTVVAIVREKETGTMEMLLVSPLKPMQIIISKMVPFLLLSCLDLAVIIAIARCLLGVPLTGGVMTVVAVTLLYILLSLALGLLISTLAGSQVVAMLVCGMLMIMPVVMLSGMIFPVENLPPGLSQLSWIVPARWYIDAMRRLMIEGVSLASVIDDILILTLMLTIVLSVAIRNFKPRLTC